MINLRIENHKIFIENASDTELSLIKKSLRVYKPEFNSKIKYSSVSLYYSYDKSFPTGYLEEFLKKTKKHKLSFNIIENRKEPIKKLKINADEKVLKSIWKDVLEHQENANEAISEEHCGIISSPTASGKTKIITDTIDAKKVKTLVLVPTTNLQMKAYSLYKQIFGEEHVSYSAPKLNEQLIIHQMAKFKEKLEREAQEKELNNPIEPIVKKSKWIKDENDPTIGMSKIEKKIYLQKEKRKQQFERMIQKRKEYAQKAYIKQRTTLTKGQMKQVYGADITVICYQSMPSLSNDFLKSIECIIIDECHHASADSIRLMLDRMPNAYYRYAFSATPWRDKYHDMQLLRAAIGNKIIFELTPQEALEKNIITRPIIQYINSPIPDTYLLKTKKWPKIVKEGLVLNRTRNISITTKAAELFDRGHNVMICVDEIGHIDELEKMLKEKFNIEPIIIHGQMKEKDVDKNIQKVGEAIRSVCIGTMAVGEGTDMPNISAIILASGGKASIRFLQRIGRGTRKSINKNKLLVFDFIDWFNPTLSKHSNERERNFKKYFGFN